MQHNKTNKFKGELGSILTDMQGVQSKLEEVMGLFTLKSSLSIFNTLKTQGHEVSKLLSLLVLLPFYGAGNIYAMVKSGLSSENKDAYYSIKNDDRIDWRKLLSLLAKRFRFLVNSRETLRKDGVTALIADDSSLHKTGKKMENISMVHDHVTKKFILGFKILVLGFWDGGSFIPIDFSIHRERGSKLRKCKESYKSARLAVQKVTDKLKKANINLQCKKETIKRLRTIAKLNPSSTNLLNLERVIISKQKAKAKVIVLQKELLKKEAHHIQLGKELSEVAKKNPEYGLSRKEKKQQFKKERDAGSKGYTRLKEADESKIAMLITMIRRAVKNGFVPDYVLTDSWFFCQELLKAVNKLSSKGVKLLSMVKIGNTKYTVMPSGKTHNAHSLIKIYERKAKYNRKLKAHYIKIPVVLSGIRINLFFVKMGQKGTWRLLATNDLGIGFIAVMEIYQLRWSIEVFFKESKQYLNLGGANSSDFDGQIAAATLAMIQHIMLTFFKRMNYQQSFGELFKEISHEIIESSLAEKLWDIFLQVLNELGQILKLDVMEIYEDIMRSEKAMTIMKQLIFQKSTLKSVA
jgi:hypothetical protein